MAFGRLGLRVSSLSPQRPSAGSGGAPAPRPGAGQATIPDGIQSWWMTDNAEVANSRLTIGYTTGAKEQGIAEIDVATRLTIETKALLTDFWRKDDHAQTPFKRLAVGANAGVLYVLMTGHGATVADPAGNDHTFYECWSTTGRIADLTAPRTVANTIGRSNLIQLFEQSNGAIWALTCDDIAPQKWLALHKTSYSAVATQKRGFFQQTAAPNGGQNQLYCRARPIGGDLLRMVVTAHPTNLQNPFRLATFNMGDGVLVSGSGTIQDIDTATGALPEATDLSAIYTPPSGKSVRLLDLSDDGNMIAFSQWKLSDGTEQEYYVLVYAGSGSIYDSANWTARKVADAGTSYMWPDSFYSYGMSFAREAHTGIRVVYARRVGSNRYLCRANSADAGVSWTETIIETNTSGSFFRPHSPVGATDSIAVVRALVTGYTDYLAWTSSLAWKANTAESALSITTASLTDPIQGAAYSQAIQSTGGSQPVTSWAVTSGAVWAGGTLNAATGVVSGTPTTPGSYTFDVTATDAEGRTATHTYSGNVQAATNLPSLIGLSTGGSPTANVTTHSVVLPASIPAGAFILLHFSADGVPTTTSPAGFTNLTDNTALTPHRQRECWKAAAGTEGGTTVSFTTSAAEKSQIIATVWAPRDAAQAPQKQGNQTSSVQNPDPSAITPAWGAANNTFITSVAIDGAITVSAPPTGFTMVASLTGESDGVSLAVAYKQDAVSTTVDPGAWTSSAASAVYRNTIALKGT